MIYQEGTILEIRGIRCKVIGGIEYANKNDGDKTWEEYRLETPNGEQWLSMDDTYQEYSISWPANDVNGYIGPEWHEVDRGEEVVRKKFGYVDVDLGERASFVEYEDATEEYILSSEVWSDGTEYSRGQYIDRKDIAIVGYEKPKAIQSTASPKAFFILFAVFFAIPFVLSILGAIASGGTKKIDKYLSKSVNYDYVTSITGNEKQKASVYQFCSSQSTTDYVAEDIIRGIEGKTISVTQRDDVSNQEIAILTKKEYCLIYHPEDDPSKVYVQVSKRKYNYTSDNAPYRSSSICTNWYRSHYYTTGYKSDSSSYKKYSSAYNSYNGETVHNIGNGYFDSYSNTVRQQSINARRSSSGGVSSGK